LQIYFNLIFVVFDFWNQ